MTSEMSCTELHFITGLSPSSIRKCKRISLKPYDLKVNERIEKEERKILEDAIIEFVNNHLFNSL